MMIIVGPLHPCNPLPYHYIWPLLQVGILFYYVDARKVLQEIVDSVEEEQCPYEHQLSYGPGGLQDP
jgi:hypothetical protein